MSPNYPACYLILRKDNKILFVQRENTGYMDGMYSLPAGRVEENETFSLAVVREALEEVGVTVNPGSITHKLTQHRYAATSSFKQWVDVFFESDDWQGTPVNKEPQVHSQIKWIDCNDLPDSIMDYQKWALETIAKGVSYTEFGW